MPLSSHLSGVGLVLGFSIGRPTSFQRSRMKRAAKLLDVPAHAPATAAPTKPKRTKRRREILFFFELFNGLASSFEQAFIEQKRFLTTTTAKKNEEKCAAGRFMDEIGRNRQSQRPVFRKGMS